MCESCDIFDTDIAIHGPGQLRRMVVRLQEAVRTDVLACDTDGSGSDTIDQELFAALDLEGSAPDVLAYDFRCKQCGATFCLSAETYHGQGGSWSKR